MGTISGAVLPELTLSWLLYNMLNMLKALVGHLLWLGGMAWIGLVHSWFVITRTSISSGTIGKPGRASFSHDNLASMAACAQRSSVLRDGQVATCGTRLWCGTTWAASLLSVASFGLRWSTVVFVVKNKG